jgi:pyruvate,water dikinase
VTDSAALAPLVAATDPGTYGGKAAQLAAALGRGLPVPDGYALPWQATASVAAGDGGVRDELHAAGLDAQPWAVRSSAVGEDSTDASFAGAHTTVLGMVGADAVLGAVRRVHASASDPAALAYRERMGIDPSPRMGVVVQQMLDVEVSGVMFTRNPVTGASERLIEASWGLGEAVVAGLVTPDQYRLDEAGRLLEHVPGEKDLALRLRPDGGVEEVEVAPDLVTSPCLADDALVALHELAAQCDRVFGEVDHDIEFAFAGAQLYLLQRRPITHG